MKGMAVDGIQFFLTPLASFALRTRPGVMIRATGVEEKRACKLFRYYPLAILIP